jgi:hypothetical protein
MMQLIEVDWIIFVIFLRVTKGWPTRILKEGSIGKMELWIL